MGESHIDIRRRAGESIPGNKKCQCKIFQMGGNMLYFETSKEACISTVEGAKHNKSSEGDERRKDEEEQIM